MSDRLDSVADVRDRLDGTRTAMVTTPDERGTLSARPLTLQTITTDGDVWFLVDARSDWVSPSHGGPINIAVSNDDSWVSFAGRAEVVTDRDRIDALEDPVSTSFFGDDAEPAALRAVTDRIEWWTSDGGLRALFEMTKAQITDDRPDVGESGAIEV